MLLSKLSLGRNVFSNFVRKKLLLAPNTQTCSSISFITSSPNNGRLPQIANTSAILNPFNNSLLQTLPEIRTEIQRTLTKFSLQSGKQKSVKAVLKRFYRLDWGIWIYGKCGRNKKLHTKSANRKRRLRQHVFTNATQSWLLDSMVTKYWRKPKYYVDDPYEPITEEKNSLLRGGSHYYLILNNYCTLRENKYVL